MRRRRRLEVLRAQKGHCRTGKESDQSKQRHKECEPHGSDVSTNVRCRFSAGQLLGSTPRSACVPPQDRKYSEQCPPQSVGGLMGHNREDDADHDADQRHDVSDAKRHFLSPFCCKVHDSKGEGRIKSLWFFCLDRRGSFSAIKRGSFSAIKRGSFSAIKRGSFSAINLYSFN